MEVWKPIAGWEGYYEVSSEGRVRRPAGSLHRYKTELVLKPAAGKSNIGYLYVTLRCTKDGVKMSESVNVHALVCEAFCDRRPPGLVARHKDGNHLNNRADNLEWGTRSENELDKVAHGTSNRGERHGLAKLSNNDVSTILQAVDAGEDRAAVAAQFGISKGYLNDLYAGRARAL